MFIYTSYTVSYIVSTFEVDQKNDNYETCQTVNLENLFWATSNVDYCI